MVTVKDLLDIEDSLGQYVWDWTEEIDSNYKTIRCYLCDKSVITFFIGDVVTLVDMWNKVVAHINKNHTQLEDEIALLVMSKRSKKS